MDQQVPDVFGQLVHFDSGVGMFSAEKREETLKPQATKPKIHFFPMAKPLLKDTYNRTYRNKIAPGKTLSHNLGLTNPNFTGTIVSFSQEPTKDRVNPA